MSPAESSPPASPPGCPPNCILIVVLTAAVLSAVGVATYLYNRQRKIKIYKLQRAQEEAAMKLCSQATTP